jgi:SAM-dependent methyltransferase
MNPQTRRALNAINRDFYAAEASAASFSATRDHAWPGWERVWTHALAAARPSASARPVLSVLDVGCGNGRFAAFLAEHSRETIHYVGVDASQLLLDRAAKRARPLARAEFVCCDLVDDSAAGVLDSLGRTDPRDLRDPLEPLAANHRRPDDQSGGHSDDQSDHQPGDRPHDETDGQPDGQSDARPGFDLVVAFGLLHHVPGFETRARLLAALADCTAPKGIFAVTLWRFGEKSLWPRFEGRVVSWGDYNRRTADPTEAIDLSQLEAGDYLLRWGDSDGDGPLRYCHYTDDAERDALLSRLPLEVIDHYTEDGRSKDLNEYLILQPRAGC